MEMRVALDIRNMDCMDLMSEYQDNHFELAIIDPPYGINASNMKMNNNNHVFKSWDTNKPNKAYFNELFRVSQNQIIWGGNYFDLPPFGCVLVWDKKQPEGVTFSMVEIAWTSFKSKSKVFYQFPSHVTQGKKIHPTQKPVKLYKWLLEKYAKPGDKILDTHAGSCSIAIACHYMGFDLTACELDKDYYEAAMKRIKEETAQISMFDGG